MAYTKQTWVDGNSAYPVSAARMGVLEQGVFDAAATADQGHRVLTTAQKTALGTVTTGTMVYDSTLNQLQVYNGTKWVASSTTNVPPSCQVIRTTDLTGYTTYAGITWSSSAWDTDGMWTSGANITINTTGLYTVTFAGVATATATLNIVEPLVYVNGTQVLGQYTFFTSTRAEWVATATLSLVATNTVSAGVSFAGGSAYVIKGNASNFEQTRLSATWLGRTS